LEGADGENPDKTDFEKAGGSHELNHVCAMSICGGVQPTSLCGM